MALDYPQIQSAVEQQHAALAAQRGVDPSAVSMMDALAAYNQAQQKAYFAPPAAPAATPASVAAPAPAGIAALPVAPPAYEASAFPDVSSLYQKVLGRDPTKTGDTAGLEWWQKEIGSGGISPEEYQKFVAAAKPELDVQSLYSQYLGRGADPKGLDYWKNKIASEGISPEEREMFYKTAVPEIVTSAYRDILGRGIAATDPGLAYYTEQLQSGALQPSDFRKTLIGGATGADIAPAQRFGIIGSEQYLNEFERARPNLERSYGLPEGSLKTDISSSALANKNLEEIKNVIRGSGANRFQEAFGLGNLAQQLYGLTDQQEKDLVGNLLKGRESNAPLSSYYNELISQNVKPETIQKVIADAAAKNPESQYFKDNPRDLLLARPVGDLQRGEETSGQYGRDPLTGFALISEKAANKALDEKGDVFLGGMQDIYDNTSLQYLGADPHSKYQGHLGRGTGALGVTASKDEITDFARIERELNRLGGVQRQVDPDTGSAMDVVYVERKDPESDRTYRVPVTAEEFFRTQLAEKYPAISEEDPSSQARFTRNFDSTSAYDYYKQTKGALDKIATDFVYKDPSRVPRYGNIKEAYDDLNDKTKSLYLWRGRTNTLDPEAMKKLGIEDPTADDSHIEVFLEKKGDYLVPKLGTDQKPMITPFKFSDPNTSSGFFGDLFNFAMEVMNTPIGMALGAYMASGPLAAASQSLGQSVVTNLGLDAALANSMSYSQIAALENIIGSSIINSGIGALPAAAGGDFDRFGRSFLTNLAGSGVQMGAGALGANPFVSKLLSAGTMAGLSGRDVEDALTRLATSQGINTLLSNVPTGDFDKNLMAAFAPAILSGKLTPSDLMRITQAVNPPTK